jgi:hypothetical protein
MIARVRQSKPEPSEADLVAWAAEVQRLVDRGEASSSECERLEALLQNYWAMQSEWDAEELAYIAERNAA